LNRLPGRIEDAEAAIAIRARELIHAVGDDAEDGESLDYAISLLSGETSGASVQGL